ncbi:MAG: hypothetical protein P4L16_02000 [Chlamydiales bacterium]|nr:hypothetical protein [Chlamydiales bacterium]
MSSPSRISPSTMGSSSTFTGNIPSSSNSSSTIVEDIAREALYNQSSSTISNINVRSWSHHFSKEIQEEYLKLIFEKVREPIICVVEGNSKDLTEPSFATELIFVIHTTVRKYLGGKIMSTQETCAFCSEILKKIFENCEDVLSQLIPLKELYQRYLTALFKTITGDFNAFIKENYFSVCKNTLFNRSEFIKNCNADLWNDFYDKTLRESSSLNRWLFWMHLEFCYFSSVEKSLSMDMLRLRCTPEVSWFQEAQVRTLAALGEDELTSEQVIIFNLIMDEVEKSGDSFESIAEGNGLDEVLIQRMYRYCAQSLGMQIPPVLPTEKEAKEFAWTSCAESLAKNARAYNENFSKSEEGRQFFVEQGFAMKILEQIRQNIPSHFEIDQVKQFLQWLRYSNNEKTELGKLVRNLLYYASPDSSSARTSASLESIRVKKDGSAFQKVNSRQIPELKGMDLIIYQAAADQSSGSIEVFKLLLADMQLEQDQIDRLVAHFNSVQTLHTQ